VVPQNPAKWAVRQAVRLAVGTLTRNPYAQLASQFALTVLENSLPAPSNAVGFTYVFQGASSVIYCPFGSGRAIDNRPMNYITAAFNCGIFPFTDPNVTPGPPVSNHFELWQFPSGTGEYASVVIVTYPSGKTVLDPAYQVPGVAGPVPPEFSQQFRSPSVPTIPFYTVYNPYDPATVPPMARTDFPPTVAVRDIPLLQQGWNHTGGRINFGPPSGVYVPPKAELPNWTPNIGGPTHPVQPPKPGMVEHKEMLPLPKFRKVVNFLVNEVTEFNDFVTAVWKAIPPEDRRRSKTMQEKLWDIYEYLPQMENRRFISNALLNVAENEIQDRAIGYVGSLGKRALKANPYWRSLAGLQTGGRYRPRPYLGG